METTGHYWMICYSFLVARSYSVAVINPMQVKAVRTLKGLDKVKNDRIDAGLIAETLRIRPVRRDQARHRRGGVAEVAARHARRAQDPVHMLDGRPFPGIRGYILRHVRGGQPRGALRVAAALRAGTQVRLLARAQHRQGIQAPRQVSRIRGGDQSRGQVLDRREARPAGRLVSDKVPGQADQVRRL
ncbi:transposase [Atopobium sp. oral taxon 416]|nr:transposase [Atopobium sp. oral taxon 416]